MILLITVKLQLHGILVYPVRKLTGRADKEPLPLSTPSRTAEIKSIGASDTVNIVHNKTTLITLL